MGVDHCRWLDLLGLVEEILNQENGVRLRSTRISAEQMIPHSSPTFKTTVNRFWNMSTKLFLENGVLLTFKLTVFHGLGFGLAHRLP
jgi:hypothetical protein